MTTAAQIAQKLLARLTDAYSKEPTSAWTKLFETLATQLAEFEDEDKLHDDIMQAHWGLPTGIGSDTGINIDMIGALFGAKRMIGESDILYRERIFTYLKSYEHGGTYDSLKYYISYTLKLLGWTGTINDIIIADNYTVGGKYGHICISIGGVFPAGFDAADWAVVLTEAMRVKAAGIAIDEIGGGCHEIYSSMIESVYYTSSIYWPREIWAEFVDTDDIIHRADITDTDSINIAG